MASSPNYAVPLASVLISEVVLSLVYLLWSELRQESAVAIPGIAATNAAASEQRAETSTIKGPNCHEDDAAIDGDTRFLFDVVARQNSAIVQNIDALDGGIIAVAVGIIAGGLFMGDKWFDMEPLWRCAALILLVESTMVVVGGYLTVYFFNGGAEDPGRLADFTVDFSVEPVATTLLAIESISGAAKTNVQIRRFKRASIVLSTLLVIAATAAVIAGRTLGSPPH